MKRIAVTSTGNKKRLVISNALSLLTGLEVVRSTPYSGFSLKNGINKSLNEYEWKELYSYTLHSFVERIEVESAIHAFVSNGSVFHEPAYLEAHEQITSLFGKKLKKDYSYMNHSLKTIISDYAVRTYDCIIYLPNEQQEMDNFQTLADEKLKNIVVNSGIKYLIYNEQTLVKTLEKCSEDMMIESTISPTTAIQKAILEITESKSNK